MCVARENFFSRDSTKGRRREKSSSRGGVEETNSSSSFVGDNTCGISNDSTSNNANTNTSSKGNDDGDNDAMMSKLHASTVLLLFDPEHLTAANFHREFFSSSPSVDSGDDSDGIDDDDIDDKSTHQTTAEIGSCSTRGKKRWKRIMGKGGGRGEGRGGRRKERSRSNRCYRTWSVHSELVLLEGLLTSPGLDKHSKSPTLWALRQWIITNTTNTFSPSTGRVGSPTPAALIHSELCIVARANNIHPRNYRAWQHARNLIVLGMGVGVGGNGGEDGDGHMDGHESRDADADRYKVGVVVHRGKLGWINSLAITHFDTQCLRRTRDISVWAFLGFLLSLPISLAVPVIKVDPGLEAQSYSDSGVESKLDTQLLRHFLSGTLAELHRYHCSPCSTSSLHSPMQGQQGEPHVEGEAMAVFIRTAVAMAMAISGSRSTLGKESESEGRALQTCTLDMGLFTPRTGAGADASLVEDDGQVVTLDNTSCILDIVQSMQDMRNIHVQRAYSWVSRWALARDQEQVIKVEGEGNQV